jgi:hypothetical protein
MFHSDNRLENNLKIIDILKTCANQNPQLRFWQLLVASKIIEYKDGLNLPVVKDSFYEESTVTLDRLKNSEIVKSKFY